MPKLWIFVRTKDGREYYSNDYILTEKDIVLFDAIDVKTKQPVGTITIKEGEWETFLAKSKPFLGGYFQK